MLQRLLLFALALIGTFLWIRRFVAPAGTATPRRGGSGTPVADSRGEMVRDRVCNTFLPRARALVARDGASEHYFCSEDCRRVFLERRSA